MRHLPWLKDKEYPLLVAPCWKRFEASGVPFVIENVEDCWELPSSTVICGLTMGLRMYRHRRFGGSVMFLAPPHQKHPETIFKGPLLNARYKNSGGVMGILPWPAGHTSMHGLWPSIQAATGIDWMTREELTQAIPPAYTEFIGIQLLQHLSLNESKEN
jgi:DNA (cytosine-5)-methyltransferase 1